MKFENLERVNALCKRISELKNTHQELNNASQITIGTHRYNTIVVDLQNDKHFLHGRSWGFMNSVKEAVGREIEEAEKELAEL